MFGIRGSRPLSQVLPRSVTNFIGSYSLFSSEVHKFYFGISAMESGRLVVPVALSGP